MIKDNQRRLNQFHVVLDGLLRVLYYDTRTPWLAKPLADDLHQQWETLAPLPQPLPDLPGIDAARAYHDEKGIFQEVTLVQGGRVMSVLWTDPYNSADFDDLVTRMAAVFAAQ